MIYLSYYHIHHNAERDRVGFGYMMFTGEAPRSKKDIDRLIASIKEVEKMPAGTDVIILSWQEMKEEPVSSVEFW